MKKNLFLVFLVLLFTTILFAQNNNANMNSMNYSVPSGIGLGTIIAVVASWSRNKSVGWAIVHAIFGWLYVIYYVLSR